MSEDKETGKFSGAAKEWLKHAVDIEHYGNSVIDEVVSQLEALYERIESLLRTVSTVSSKRVYEELLEEIANYIEEFESSVNSILESGFEEIVDTESGWLLSFGKALGLSYLMPRTIRSQVQFVPFGKNSSYKDVAENTGSRLLKAVDSALRTAYLMKESTDTVNERIQGGYGRVERNLTTDTRTFNTAVFRHTDLMAFRYNRQKVRYSAVLDSHTCLSCGSMHGIIFNADSAPAVPVHENCRCTLIPVIDGMEDEEFSSFSEWIETLDDDELYDVLGKSRYNLYKSGLSVDSFVDSGETLTIEQLKERYPDRF